METALDLLKLLHVLAFVFMAIPLFNLIVVNERAQLATGFDYYADRYMENIIRRGATRCFAFQTTVLVSGVLLLIFGPLGIGALWGNWVILVKTLLLFTLMGLLSYVHFNLQPKIEALLADVGPEAAALADLVVGLKPHRVLRKRLATFCLFVVLVSIILGMQVYRTFDPILNLALIVLAGLFAVRANRTLVRFGWV